MAQTNEGGGGGISNHSKERERDTNIPIYKKDEFKDTVNKIKRGESVGVKVASPVKFELPVPGANYARYLNTTQKGATHNPARYEKFLTEEVRKKVQSENTPGMRETKDAYNARVEKETKRLVDIIKKPRYTFLSDGTPFYMDKKDERADLERSLMGESPLRRRWMLAKYDIASGINSLISFVGKGAVRGKEYLTDLTMQGNVAGAVAQLGLNSALLGWQYIRAGDYPIFATEERAAEIEREAEALKYTHPEVAEARLKTAQEMRKGVLLKKEYQESLELAGRAVDSAWASLFTEFKEAQEIGEDALENAPEGMSHQERLSYIREQRIKAENLAKQEAINFRSQASEAYANGDFERAMELTQQAQEQDRKSQLADPYGAYSWIREPERYSKFKKDAALLELQKGSPLTPDELRRLKEYHVNSWTEITGEAIFDPINLIPAAFLEKIISVPMKGARVVGKAAMKVPGVAKTTHVLGSPVRWFLRESVTSGATRIARNTYNIMERISNGYTSAEEVTKAMDAISNVVLEAGRAANEKEARAIFDAARKSIPGLQQVTFRDFKQLMDAGAHIDATQWGKLYSDSLTIAETNLEEVIAKTGKASDDVVSEVSKNRWALEGFSQKFYDAFKDPHRIFKGSRLTDDTLSGWITKKLRAMSGDDINDMMKLTRNDEWLLEKSARMGNTAKMGVHGLTRFVEASLSFAAFARDLWATTVLTTFRWPINNLMDTSMRSAVYGGNLWDDMVTLFTSTQRTLADELGFSPIEFNQALSRQELKFTESVPHRLLYEGWKPKAGIFSYMGYEYKRLLTQYGDKAVTKSVVAEGVLKGMPDGQLKSALASVLDGYNYRVNVWTAIRAMPGAVSDFNTAIEFTFRLRMFHQEYFKLLKKLEPEFIERGMDSLSPATREIAKQIWKAAEGNPRRITAYVDNLIGKTANTPAKWSFVVPPELDDILKGMDAGDQQLFIHSVKNELDEFIETSTRSGKTLTDQDFKKFFDDYKVKMQDEIQERLSAAHDFRDADTGIRTDGQANDVLTEDDIQGSMPTGRDESPRTKQLDEALKGLKRKGKRRSTIDISKDFETAISEYATVERVGGDGVRVKRVNGKLVVEVGDNALKQKHTKFYDEINRTVISILKHQDADTIKIGFGSLDDYDTVMRKFLDDPTEVLAENEQQFLILVNQMENNPTIRTIIEQTSPKTVRRYDSALDVYRDIGEYSDVYGFNVRPDVLFESEAQKIRPIPGSHTIALTKSSALTRQLADLGKSLEPEIGDRVRQIVDNFTTYRQELKQFYAFTYPGPLMRSTNDAGRHTGWDLFYRMSEAEFLKEADLKAKLIDLIEKDPEAATRFLDETNGNFAEWFLKQNGIELEWDADRQLILNMKVRGLDGKPRNFTARHDIANLQIRFFSPQAKRSVSNPYLRVLAGDELPIERQLRNALRETFDLSTAKAEAWAKAIDNHAQKWAQETGQPIEKYYERLGFQKVDSSSAKGLGTLEQTRIVKRGAVGRTGGGTFMFFGLSHSNFESVVRETGELFFDDLISMADHSPQAADDLKGLKSFLEEKTGKKIRANRLQQDHSDLLADVFSSYIATGHGPNITIKGGFERLKGWITQTFDAIRDTNVAGEIPDDVYRVLDRMFIETKMAAVPKTNARLIRQMAKEANLVADDPDDLLKIINDALSKPQLTPDELVEVQKLEDEVKALEAQYQDLLNERADLAGDNTMANATIGSDPRLVQLEAELDSARNKVSGYYIARSPAGQTYTDLGDVPKDVAARILGVQESKIASEISEGWEVWKTQRGLTGFPDSALADPDTLKAYLRQRMGEEWSEASNYYNRLLWEVEQFEDAMLNFHAGDDLRSTVFPRVHDAQISNGMKTFVRNQQHMISNYEMARRALDSWGEYMGKLTKEGHPAGLLPKDEQAALKAWAYNDGSKAKAELVSTILHGGDNVEGAIDRVNRVMLDYQHTNVTDQFMKNFFPFWMFPSRSFPFWAETMATHPQLIAGYDKLQRLSRSQRYQAGAVTSQGYPMPSLDGYIQIPGTDTWFNPLAPFSFRYLLDIQKTRDDIMYAAKSEDDIDPKTFITSELMSTGQMYGFSLGPWAAWGLKKAFGIPDEILPRYPLIPEIQLVPRWMVQEQIQRLNQMNFWGMKGMGDQIYPEVPWHDYTVETRILENALQQIQSGKLTEADKIKLMNKAQNAIKTKDGELWKQTYQEVTHEEWVRSTASFFSGLYVKDFGDGEADLLALRNHTNMLKSALNNEFQANVFDLPVDAEAGWDHYLKVLDTPEGWVHRLRTDAGWVSNDKGELVRDPKERARWLAVKIEQNERQQMYYDKMASIQKEFNKRLHALPIGADWEQTRIIYDWYAEQRKSLEHLREYEKFYGTNKPTELIQKDMASDWFREINSTRPQWDMKGGETYESYQQRVMEWEENLPKLAATYMRMYSSRTDVNKTLASLHPDQAFSSDEFFAGLVAMTNKEGLEMYGKESDDIFDALNKAWKATYWDEYWNSVIGKDGYEVDLAEKDFYSKHPNPPSADELFAWINQYYGPKFTADEIKKYVEGTDELDILQRQLQKEADPVDYTKRQEIWDMLSWIGPGNKNRGVFDQAFANAGGDPDWLTTWYQESGEAYKDKPERLEQMHDAIKEAIRQMGLKPPDREELVRYVQAQEENDAFKQMVAAELGNQFFDYTDEDGKVQKGVYSYYNSLDYEAKKEFRGSFPDEYEAIETYYLMKETYAEEHLTWADYYGFDTEPSVTLPTDQETGSTLIPPPLRARRGGGGGGGGGGGRPEYRPTEGVYGKQPSFSIYNRTGNYVSPGLFDLVGNKMAWEITNLFSNNRRISSSGVSFLKSVKSRYPQYAQEIDRILSR